MVLLPPVPTRQGASSSTFVTPPVDGSITAAQLFDFNAENSPDHPFFVYQEPATKELVEIPWKTVRLATHRVSKIVQSYNVPAPRIIGILALVDTISYFTLVHGIIRAGYVPFPLSPRNSPAAIAHLLSKTECTHIFVSEDPSMQGLSAGSLKVLAGQGGHSVERIPVPFFDDVYAEATPEELSTITKVSGVEDLNTLGFILHSSGSTSFPKPIRLTHRILVEWLRIPSYGEIDFCGEVIGAVALPMFHALGAINSIAMASSGAVLGVFKPVRQPPFPTPDRVLESVSALKVNVLFAIPVFLEAWAHDPANVEPLKQCRAVIFSGGPLSKVVGDALAAEGVHLMQALGITEVGCANVFIPKEVNGHDWEYFEFSKQHHVVLVPQPDTDAVEFQLLPCETHTPAVLNVKIDGKDGYSTNDLVLEHPTKRGFYKVLGRVDDQIMLSTGEKTNPGPLEAIISKDPLIDGAVMFGRGRTQNGVVIQPAARLGLDVTDPVKVATYLDSIWPAIKMANDYAPAHSRLFKEMIILAKPTKPFTFTGKGSIRKSAVVADYDDEIQATYAAVEAATSANVDSPETWTKETTLDFVRTVVHKVMESKIEDDQDIFQYGGDSLQATVIRNSIANALTTDQFDVSSITANFVYESPSIAQLAVATFAIIDPSSFSAADRIAQKVAEIDALIEKYSANLPVHTPSASASAPSGDVIVMTGSTGALGTTILAQLVDNPAVSKVYALNRKGAGKTLKQRQVASLVDRGWDASLASSPKVVLVETDAKLGPLGLSPALYDEIRSSATAIIHTAWRVDFNLALSTFEPLFGGLRELIDLALRSPLPSPPRLLFASSISIYGDWHSSTPAPEAPIDDPKTVVGTGYGESKWVAERLLAYASKTTPLQPVIIRIGQLSGGKNGSWNAAEWVPAVVRSGEVVGALPASDEEVSWLPLQNAAAAIIDFRTAPSSTVHLAHPYPASWTSIFGPIAQALGVPLVPYSEWLDRLEADLSNPAHSEVEAATANPALRLIDMFRPYRNGPEDKTEAREAMGVPKLQTAQAVKASSALSRQNLPPLGKEDALRWLQYWQRVGLIKTKTLADVKEANGTSVTRPGGISAFLSNPPPLLVAGAAVVSITYMISLIRRSR